MKKKIGLHDPLKAISKILAAENHKSLKEDFPEPSFNLLQNYNIYL